jgi:hypothetical protein
MQALALRFAMEASSGCHVVEKPETAQLVELSSAGDTCLTAGNLA